MKTAHLVTKSHTEIPLANSPAGVYFDIVLCTDHPLNTQTD